MKKTIIAFSTLLLLFGNGPAPAAAGPDEAFNDNKQNLVVSHDFLKKFVYENDTAEAIKMAEDAPLFIELAEKTLAALEAAIPAPLSNYERKNPEAKEIRLGSKASFLKGTYIPKARKKAEGLRSDILQAIDSDVEWLGSRYANLKHAPAAIERVKAGFAALDKIAKGDAGVAAKKKTQIPKAMAAYKKLIAQAANNRMPQGKYNGADRASLEQTMAKLYEARYPGQKVARVVIESPAWSERARAEIKDNRIVAGVYRYIHAYLAARKDASATVYSVVFSRTWTGKGDAFGPVEIHSYGESYPILPQNINK